MLLLLLGAQSGRIPLDIDIIQAFELVPIIMRRWGAEVIIRDGSVRLLLQLCQPSPKPARLDRSWW
eukprot:7027-Pyramimonas_sp.AAC.3